jgi:hypothetical protein
MTFHMFFLKYNFSYVVILGIIHLQKHEYNLDYKRSKPCHLNAELILEKTRQILPFCIGPLDLVCVKKIIFYL